jgi:hypothetical protein
VAEARLCQCRERLRRRHQHPGGALHERLHDDGGELVRVRGHECGRGVERAGCRQCGRPHHGKAQRVEDLGAEAAVADGEGSDRVTVVGVAEREEPGATLDTLVDPELERDLERLLHCAGPVRREQEVGGVDRHDAGQCLGELDDHPVAVAEHGRVRGPVELGPDGVVELGDAVAERAHPQGRDRVEVAAAVDVDQLVALGPVDDDGSILGVARHLREPVPHDRGVSLDPPILHGCGW